MPIQTLQERHQSGRITPGPGASGPITRQAEVLRKARNKRLLLLRDELLKAAEKFDMLPESPALEIIKAAAQASLDDPTYEKLDLMYTVVGVYLGRADILPSSQQLTRVMQFHQDVESPNLVGELEANLETGFAASASGEGDFRTQSRFEVPIGEAADELPALEMDVDDAIRLDATGFSATGSDAVSVVENSHVTEGGERIRERILVPTVSQADLDQDEKLWVRILHGEMEIIPLEPFDPDDFDSGDTPGEPNRVELLSELWWQRAPSTATHRDTRYFPYNEEHFIIYNTSSDRWELWWYGDKVSEGSLPYVRSNAMQKARDEIANLEDAELKYAQPQRELTQAAQFPYAPEGITPEDVDEPGQREANGNDGEPTPGPMS